MGKSILVMDTPECCDYCPAGRIFGTAGQVECRAGRGIAVNPDGRTVPDWCPLQPSSETEVGRRLIDANRFKNLVTAVCIMDGRSPEFLNEFCRLIDSQPTAYDVDKVVKRFEEMRDNTKRNITLNSQEDDIDEEISRETRHYQSIIRTVKSGGIE